jgi:hypothetical protein
VKSGFQVKIVFKITQHSIPPAGVRDKELMKTLVDYYECGEYYPRLKEDGGDFVVTRFSDVRDKIIPFCDKYPIVGVKALDFADFCKAAEIMKVKGHLTESGLAEIRKIKAGMNKGRKN